MTAHRTATIEILNDVRLTLHAANIEDLRAEAIAALEAGNHPIPNDLRNAATAAGLAGVIRITVANLVARA